MSGYTSQYLSFNFTNPNLAALWILQTILYVFIAIIYFKNKFIKLFCSGLLFPLFIFLYETESRTSLIALVIFIALSIFVLVKRNIKIRRLIIAFLVLFPIIAAFIYLTMADNGNLQQYDVLFSEAKALSSRTEVWTNAFEMIKAHSITGAYYQISDGTGSSQMHNTHIDVWASYGTIVFILLIIYLIRIVISISEKCTLKLQTISVIAFLGIIVMGTGEAALFSGGVGIYILSCSFLLLAKCEYN